VDTGRRNPPLRPYKAIIWGSDLESKGIRTTYLVVDLDHARRQLVAEHGEKCISSLWNEEDADKLR